MLSLSPERERIIEQAINALNSKRNAHPDDPVLVVFWNEARLRQLARQQPQPKQQIQQFLVDFGAETMGPMPENFFFFREPSLLAECKEQMQSRLPWAFAVGPHTAAIIGIPAGVPVADSAIIFKTEKVKPDISKSTFFLA
jgi:hypothetical protein